MAIQDKDRGLREQMSSVVWSQGREPGVGMEVVVADKGLGSRQLR